jgi:hypothetical protein
VQLEVEPASIELTLPVVDGPAPLPEPPRFTAPPGAPHEQVARRDAAEPPLVWRVEHDVLDRRTRVVVEHGATYGAPHDGIVVEAYAGEVGVDLADPARAWASATTRFELTWPELAATAEARLDVRSTADVLDVRIALDVTADGEPFAARRWHEVIPRDLL